MRYRDGTDLGGYSDEYSTRIQRSICPPRGSVNRTIMLEQSTSSNLPVVRRVQLELEFSRFGLNWLLWPSKLIRPLPVYLSPLSSMYFAKFRGSRANSAIRSFTPEQLPNLERCTRTIKVRRFGSAGCSRVCSIFHTRRQGSARIASRSWRCLVARTRMGRKSRPGRRVPQSRRRFGPSSQKRTWGTQLAPD
jgi:hypothetical protein